MFHNRSARYISTWMSLILNWKLLKKWIDNRNLVSLIWITMCSDRLFAGSAICNTSTYLPIGHQRWNSGEYFIKTRMFSLKERRLKMLSTKRRPFGFGRNALMEINCHQGRPIAAALALLGHRQQNFIAPHDDVIKWKHFPRNWPFVRSPVNSPHKGQWRGALMFSLICAWIND